MTQQPHRNRRAMGVIVGLALIAVIASQIGLGQLGQSLLNADYRFLAPSSILFLLGLLTRAQRWKVLLQNQLELPRAFHIMNIAYLVNGILPLRLGEIARIYMASRANSALPAMQASSAILVERLLDVLAVAILATVSVAVSPVSSELQSAGLLGAATSIGGFATLILLARGRGFAEGLINSLSAKSLFLTKMRLNKHIGDFFDGLKPILDYRSMALALLWTAASWILSVMTNYVLMLAFFDSGDVLAVMLSIASASFAIAIPIVPGNIGTYEGSIFFAFMLLGYDQMDKVVAFALIVHGQNVLVNIVTGAYGLWREGLSLHQLRGESQNHIEHQ